MIDYWGLNHLNFNVLACPIIDMSQIKRFVEDNKIIFFPIFLFLGIILAFFGLKMNKLAFFLAGFFLGTGAILVKIWFSYFVWTLFLIETLMIKPCGFASLFQPCLAPWPVTSQLKSEKLVRLLLVDASDISFLLYCMQHFCIKFKLLLKM